MTEEVTQDETAGFVTTSNDLPEVQPESQEEQTPTEEATPEVDATVEEGKEADKETDEPGTDTAADTDKAKKPNGVQKRIDQVVREREDEKRKNESLEARIKELEGKQQKPEEQAEVKEPVESDFDTYDEYLDALDKFDKQPDQKVEKEADTGKEDKQTQADEELTDSQKTALAITQERVASAEKPEDFEAVALNPDLPVTGEMLEALAECDDPAKVMYHLGQNKDLATDIAGQSPAQQMRAIAKLDLTVKSKPPKPTKTTNAPEPISPVGGSDAQEKSVSDMSFAEYEAHMNKKEQKRKSSW
jgi:hypothetical protein